MNESQKYITLPPVTANSAAMFFEDENPAEARLLEVQHENARYIWQSIVQREDFRAAQYMTQSGQTRILSPSTRDGIDWQLSYIGADGIPNMHGDYTEPEHRRDENNPEEIFRSLLHPEEVKPQGHSMEELFKELARDGGRHERTVTLMLDEAQKGDNSVDERNSLFIAEMAKRYAVYNRTPISPESELFRAYEEKFGTVDRAEYQRILTDTLTTGGQPPRMAILQPQMDGLVFRRYEDVRRNENFKSENYEIVYISDEMGEATPNEVYAKFNEPGARPGDYYGTSVSVGNILVYERDGEFTAHFVENAGFTELPEDFLDFQTRQKIQFGLDVRQEQGLLQRNVDFVTEQGIDLDVSQDIARLEAIKRDFEAPFRLADLRTVNEAHQNVLETIYEYQQESGRDYGVIFSDGMYYAADRNDSNRIFSNNAEDYREEINNRLAMVAQRYAQENKTAYRMEATLGYRGEPGQYPFFVQRYEQAEPGRRTPEEVVFMGDAEAASYFTNHINAMTALGEELLTNVELRQTLNMPVLQGGIDNLLITDVERENNALMERMDERTDRIQRAMEAAGYTYDEINSAEEPDGEQYFTYEGGQMRFANETEALEWISGVVFDDPERQEAVDRILHPEAFQNAEDLEQYARQNPDSLLHAVYGQEEAERPHREDVDITNVPERAVRLAERIEAYAFRINETPEQRSENRQAIALAIANGRVAEYIERMTGRLNHVGQEYADGLLTLEESQNLRADLQGIVRELEDFSRNPIDNGEIAARYQSRYEMQDGYTMNIAIIREADGYHNHFLYDEDKGKGAAGTGAFATLEDARQDVLAHNPDAWEVEHFMEQEQTTEKTRVAIESTEDYTEGDFHSDLINLETQNEDGTWGQTKDLYRVVSIGRRYGRVSMAAYNDMVFESREAAQEWVNADNSLELVEYDRLIYDIQNQRLAETLEMIQNMAAQENERQTSLFTARDGNEYEIVEQWETQYGEKFAIGNFVNDRDFYIVTVDGEEIGHREYEFDRLPTRQEAEDRFIDDEAERDINRREAETDPTIFVNTEHVQENREQERYTYYSLRRPVSPGTYPRDGLVDFENFDRRSMVESIGREAWAVLHYDRELTEQEMRDYELAAGEPKIAPVREFFDNEGKILVGSDIGLNRGTGQVDRTQVYEAVWDFENANRDVVRHPVIDRDGDYLDRSTLYTGYDQYIGMSHMQDRELAPYGELIEAAVQESGRSSSKDWLKEVYTAEVYYAYKNGLTPEQIQYMVEKSVEAEADLPVFTSARESMRNIRHAFEQGMTPEQVDISLGQEDFVQQTILAYLHDGGDMERAKALRGADMATAHYITMEYGTHHLSAEKAAAIVQTVEKIHAARLGEGIFPTPDSYMEEDYLTEALAEISRDSGISAEAIRQIGADFAAQTQERDLRKFVESQENGIATYYPHGEDGLRQIAEEMNSRLAEAAGTYRTDGYTQSKVEMHSIWEESARLALDMGIRLDAVTLYDTHHGSHSSEYGVIHLTPDNIEDFFAYAKSDPIGGGGQSPFRGYERRAYISADYIHANIPTFAAMRVLDRIREQEIVRRRDAQVQVQAASVSSVPGYVVMSQYDRTGQNPGERIYLGLAENYRQDTDRGIGIYDNSDNSIVHVSDNPNMFSFLDAGQGWTQSQQEMIDNGAFTAADYAEYDRIQREVIADFPGAKTKYFSIDTNREGSGVPFSPNWQTEAQRPHGEEERSKQDMTKEQERTTAAEGVSQPEEKKSARDLLAEQLTQGVKDVMNSDNYKNWLSTSSRLFTKSYSFNNAMLIFSQKPEASYAMGYEAWKEYGRNVAQGAQGAKIFVPVMAYEKTEGALHRMIMSNLREQLKQNPGQTAVYKVGMSKCEFTMNESGQVGLRLNGKERGIFANQQDMKKFISNAILGKIPMYYNVGTVFDVKDTIVPEHLWVKKGYTKDEVVKDENGKPIKNKRGEVKIVNTPERQARFQTSLDLSITEKDPAKMAVLYEALKAVSERNGIPVTDVSRDSDETLRGGADGYFSRQFSEQNPKGFIIMPDDLEPTKKCAVLMHEMGHSDLHGNLAKLAAEMQEKNIPRNMREIQAESVAFATASQFGIETDTSSFAYLAAYTKGFDLQDLKKSLDVIYNECKKLTQEIGAELDARGLNLDLTEKPLAPMEKESVEALSKQYTAYALEQSETVHSRMSEIPALAADNRANPDLLSVLKEQKSCLDRQEASLAAITGGVEKLQSATTREAQNEAIEGIEAAKRSIESEKTRFSDFTTSFTEISSQSKATLKEEFARDPKATLEAMKQDYPKLKNLSAIQLSYVAQSEYVKKEYGSLLKSNPEKFVDAACQRAEALDKVVAKNGAFVEVNFCEQWTDKPIVQGGALLHPNVANAIIKQAETQIRGLRSEAEKMGDYFPYTKCDITVFHKTETGKDLDAYRTRVDIGDKGQTSLTDHLTQLCGKESGLVEDFSKATRERGAKDKVAFNEAPEAHEEAREDVQEKPDASTREEWTQAIEQEKAADSRTQEAPEQEKQKGKDNKEH